jgi:Mg2+-importing ATPase
MIVFASLWFIFKVRDVATFQTIWFSYSITSNLIGMHIIRTAKLPFIQSNAHKAVYISSISLIIIGILVPFTVWGSLIGLVPIAIKYIFLIFAITALYCVVAIFAKKHYIKKYGEWI